MRVVNILKNCAKAQATISSNKQRNIWANIAMNFENTVNMNGLTNTFPQQEYTQIPVGYALPNDINSNHNNSNNNNVIMQPQQIRMVNHWMRRQEIVIFDWDDTLFPKNLHTTASAESLNKAGFKVFELLTKYIVKFGAKNVFIVTNGSHSWVHGSTCLALIRINRELPESMNWWLEIYKVYIGPKALSSISIISARDRHFNQYPNTEDSGKWKELAFQELVVNHFKLTLPQNPFNQYFVASFGDSLDEFNAALIAKAMLQSMGCQSIMFRMKLKKTPTINDIINKAQHMMDLADSLKTMNQDQSIIYSNLDANGYYVI